MKSRTETIIKAMQILSIEVHSDDGIANSAIAEAAERLSELQQLNDELAAQSEQMQKLLHVLITDIEWHHTKTAFVPLALAVKAANFKDAVKATPTQCLAEVKAQVAEQAFIDGADNYFDRHYDSEMSDHVLNAAKHYANQIRQQAKAGEL